jgi:hypothetical protein
MNQKSEVPAETPAVEIPAEVPATETPAEEVPAEDKNTDLPVKEEGGDADPEESQDDPESDPETPPAEIAFPEGTNFSEDQQAGLITAIKEAGNSQEAFDELVKMVGDLGSSERAATDDAAKLAEESTLSSWSEDLKKDPNFGPKYNDNQKIVNEFLAEQPEAFNKVINDSLMVKNPDFVKGMLTLAKQRKDAEIITTGTGSSKQSVQRDAQGRAKFNFDKTFKKE